MELQMALGGVSAMPGPPPPMDDLTVATQLDE